MRSCTQCGVQHDKKNSWCNSCRAAGMRKYRATPQGKASTRRMEQNRTITEDRITQIKALQKKYAQTDRGRAVLRAASKRYNEKHRLKRNDEERKRRQSDPLFRMAANLRRRLREVLGSRNPMTPGRMFTFLDCSFADFKQHIERQFTNGMTWDNYGEWQLDHIVPLASAKDAETMRELSKYTNIQPMWAKYNRLKQNMLPDEWAAYIQQHQIDVTVSP